MDATYLEEVPLMSSVIAQLLDKYGVTDDYDSSDCYLRLMIEDQYLLVIENYGVGLMCVSQYALGGRQERGEYRITCWHLHRSMTFFTGNGLWGPVEVTHGQRAPQSLIPVGEGGRAAPGALARGIRFAERWACDLVKQGWFEDGKQC